MPLKLCLLISLTLCGVPTAQSQDNRPVIIVELFTSEGCSSCPPADGWLESLERKQPISNARIVGLEEHVDYWNHLGWRDPFAAPQYSARQNDYGQRFRVESLFTPQIIVNGQKPNDGGDFRSVQRRLNEAMVEAAYALTLTPEHNPKDSSLTDLTVRVRHLAEGKPVLSDIFLAVTESRLVSTVPAGENAGRVLRHGPVVRSFGVLGSIDQRPFTQVGLKSTLKLPEEWKRQNLRAVVFVQERESRRITGAAVVDLGKFSQ